MGERRKGLGWGIIPFHPLSGPQYPVHVTRPVPVPRYAVPCLRGGFQIESKSKLCVGIKIGSLSTTAISIFTVVALIPDFDLKFHYMKAQLRAKKFQNSKLH